MKMATWTGGWSRDPVKISNSKASTQRFPIRNGRKFWNSVAEWIIDGSPYLYIVEKCTWRVVPFRHMSVSIRTHLSRDKIGWILTGTKEGKKGQISKKITKGKEGEKEKIFGKAISPLLVSYQIVSWDASAFFSRGKFDRRSPGLFENLKKRKEKKDGAILRAQPYQPVPNQSRPRRQWKWRTEISFDFLWTK